MSLKKTKKEEDDSLQTDISTCATQASSIETASTENDVFGKYKSKSSIFTSLETKNEKTEESQFLTSEKRTEDPPQEEEEQKHLYLERGTLYRFDNEWVCLGDGTVVVLDDEGEKRRRLVFSRQGVNITALNFWINIDLKAQHTGKVAKFFVPESKDGGVTFVFHALRFKEPDQAKRLFELISEASDVPSPP